MLDSRPACHCRRGEQGQGRAGHAADVSSSGWQLATLHAARPAAVHSTALASLDAAAAAAQQAAAAGAQQPTHLEVVDGDLCLGLQRGPQPHPRRPLLIGRVCKE